VRPAAQLGGRMLDKAGPRRPMVLGSLISCAGFGLWAGHLDHFSLGAQWPYIVMAGAGLGLLVGPASTDAVNRAIGASYGEVTGITQTVRNYGSTLGMAVFGTVLTSELATRLTGSLTSLGVPPARAATIAAAAANGGGPGAATAPPAIRAQLASLVARDFASATQWVLYGMAIALGLTFLAARRHPGRRAAELGGTAAESAQAALR
jgi:hypothetical protein